LRITLATYERSSISFAASSIEPDHPNTDVFSDGLGVMCIHYDQNGTGPAAS
jgi:hypothetical protein